MKKIAMITIIALSITACQSADPYTGEQKVNNTTKVGFAGAALGTVVGALAGGKDGALIGAAAGGALGAGAGHYFDKQEATLREELSRTGVGIKRVGENQLQLIMPGNFTFKSNSSAVSPASYDVLNSISKVLDEYGQTSISIMGYTDNTGNDTINKELSQERADAVYYYLNGRGIDKGRMISAGYGPSNPIADNSTEDGREKNRRVEIRILGN